MRWSTAFFAYLFACYGLGVATTLIAQETGAIVSAAGFGCASA
jgi:hypothetical protein